MLTRPFPLRTAHSLAVRLWGCTSQQLPLRGHRAQTSGSRRRLPSGWAAWRWCCVSAALCAIWKQREYLLCRRTAMLKA